MKISILKIFTKNDISCTILGYFLKTNKLIQSCPVRIFFNLLSAKKISVCLKKRFIEFDLQIYNSYSSFYSLFSTFSLVTTPLHLLSISFTLFSVLMDFCGRMVKALRFNFFTECRRAGLTPVQLKSLWALTSNT